MWFLWVIPNRGSRICADVHIIGTPGIVMSLYAVVRNAYNPETKKFHLSAREIEMEGHLDGNLCRCTGYRPILDAFKSFASDAPPSMKQKIKDIEVLNYELLYLFFCSN